MTSIDYLRRWCERIAQAPSKSLTRVVIVEGVRDVHLGPKLEYARITLTISQSERLEIVMGNRPDGESERAFLDAAILGFLDVVLVADLRPWRNLRVSVSDFHVDPVSSSVSAFQRAGRDAGVNFLKEVGEVRAGASGP